MYSGGCMELLPGDDGTLLRRYQAIALPITGCEVVIAQGAQGDVPAAYVSIETASRPDVADFFRVHRLEPTPNDFDVTFEAFLSPLPDVHAFVGARVDLFSPVVVSFQVVFDWANRDHQTALLYFGMVGALMLSPTIPTPETIGNGIMFMIDPNVQQHLMKLTDTIHIAQQLAAGHRAYLAETKLKREKKKAT